MREEFISESDAVRMSGVSEATLTRFAEVGYLTVETNYRGEKCFSRKDIERVFRLDGSVSPATTTPSTRPSVSTPLSETKPFPSLSSQVEQVTSLSTNTDEGLRQVPEFEDNDDDTAEYEESPPLETSAPSSKASLSTGDGEVPKLREVVRLQESILTMREQEIADLKQQRDWLKARVEKLEEQSDRDRVILLSETRTIRQLIHLNDQQARSPLRSALEYFGFVQKRPAPLETAPIEIREGRS